MMVVWEDRSKEEIIPSLSSPTELSSHFIISFTAFATGSFSKTVNETSSLFVGHKYWSEFTSTLNLSPFMSTVTLLTFNIEEFVPE